MAGRFDSLGDWLAAAAGAASARITAMSRLSGGAIQENWLLDVTLDGGRLAGARQWVLRTDAASTISTSLGRAQEFAILRAAFRAGVSAPEPLLLCEDEGVIGGPFYIMARGRGTAHARRITRDPALARFGPALAGRLGRELARLHRVTPPVEGLGFLDVPQGHHAAARIAGYRADLDALPDGHPILEAALNWLEDNMPASNGTVLCHTDFRTGNYMVADGELSVIVDWEFASFSDPYEDIGWLCARCWRFGNDDLTVGGIAGLEDFLSAYEAETGLAVNRAALPNWQVMAELRWGIIALQQAQCCNSGTEITQELALTGLMPAEMELNILNLIDGARAA